jgi:ATP-dependent 26S proteasome regulatory subunit
MRPMDEPHIRIERAQNLWASFERKQAPIARGARLTASPDLHFDQIGGLAGPKEEILTYACAATSPGVYQHWGTFPPSALLLIGQVGVGKNLLARALATRTDTSFLRVDVPRLVVDMVHAAAKVGDFIASWSQILEEMPPLTVFFDELEFSQAREIGARRVDLPIGPIMDFLLELVDRSIAADGHLVMGATSHPDTLRHAFVAPGRFERVVEVTPVVPDDVIAALQVHTAAAEKRAGRPLFDTIDWTAVVGQSREASIGDWVRVLHAVLRRKARCEAAGEAARPVTTGDLRGEVDRFLRAQDRLHVREIGNYV